MIIDFLGISYAIGSAYVYIQAHKGVVEIAKGALDTFKLGKDVKDYFEVKEGDPKLVDGEWVEKSGFKDQMKQQGYELVWSRAERVATRLLEGYDLMYEIDQDKKVKQKLVRYDKSTLMGKKD